ncbi:PREDICTED: dnaJ homolog subfamily C member 7-like [Acropora digitifera]|uniref:dnaJ homolog subfamily C member 7-like n=1 Tax=Acropora digitifera TaxID=70779 RepID=UPI00077B0F1B|nr:PREDICTED: dnaJ homolog subfamily C member 7-like [Acropora digitifera]
MADEGIETDTQTSDVLNGEEDQDQMDVDQEAPPDENSVMAEEKKAEGNQQYSRKNYEEAVKLYTEAIVVTYYGNRSAAHMMLSAYDKALEDAQSAMKLDENFLKGYYRAAKCHLAMGSIKNAIMYLEKVLERDPKNKDAQNDLRTIQMVQEYESSAFKAYDKKEYGKVVFCMKRILEVCPACMTYQVLKAEALCLMGKYSESITDVHYFKDIVDKAYQHFNAVLRNDPDHTKAMQALKKAKRLQSKKQEGNESFSKGQYQKAYDIYTEALQIDPVNKATNAKLYYNRALVGSKLKKTEEAIDDCNQAIELDHAYLKAYITRARCYMESEKYEEAVRDYEKVFKMNRCRGKKFYDRWAKSFRKNPIVNEAYSILSDQRKRARYDSGQDLDDGPMDFDPNSIFQAFFNAPGFGGFSFGGPGAGAGGYSPGGFPGGFQFTFG